MRDNELELVGLRVLVHPYTLARLDALLEARGLSREEAVAEAIRDWALAREGSLDRQRRLRLERAMREAPARPLEGFSRSERQDLVRGVDVPSPAVVRSPVMAHEPSLSISRPLRTMDEAAEQLRLSRTTIERFVASGELKSLKIGRSVRISEQAIEEFLAERVAT